MNTINHNQITEQQFFDHYLPVEGPEESLIQDFEDVREKPECHVWTVVDGDDGGLYALAGFHVVNRVGYILTERPWPHEQAEAVYIAPDEDDDDEDDQRFHDEITGLLD